MCLSYADNNFFFNDTANTEIYTLSLHDALPIYGSVFWHPKGFVIWRALEAYMRRLLDAAGYEAEKTPQLMHARQWEQSGHWRSEEHTSELQSRQYLVCRLLLERTPPINASATSL